MTGLTGPEGAKRRARLAAARLLLRAALEVERQEKRNLSVGNPSPHNTPSRPGEYPRLRTGFGRAGVTFAPDTLEELATTLRVKIGYTPAAFYLGVLGLKRDRKWLADTLAAMRGRLGELGVTGSR